MRHRAGAATRRVGVRHRVVAAASAVLLLLVPVAALATNDPYRGQQWALDVLRAEEAWTVTRGEGAVVAIIDTGVDLEHPDLRDRFLRGPDGRVLGLDLVDGDDEPQDVHGHGTLVAGIVAATADNGIGIAGVAPEASLLPVRVLDGEGAGNGDDVDRAIRWAVDQGADVINLSLEAAQDDDGARSGPGVPTAAVRYAWRRGVVVVAAAGNQQGAAAAYPADTPVLLVGAVDRRDRPASFSQVDRDDAVLAPGVDIVSTWCRPPGGRTCDGSATYGLAEGTSFAAPHVAGIAALLASRGLGHEEIVDRLRATAVDLGEPGPDRTHGAGRVDAAAALGVEGAPAGAAQQAAPEEGAATTSAPAAVAPAPPPPPAPEPSAAPTATDAPTPATEPPAPDPAPPVSLQPVEPVGQAGAGIPMGEVLVQLFAAALVGGCMATWSAVVRARG